jgi:hypothetical protein
MAKSAQLKRKRFTSLLIIIPAFLFLFVIIGLNLVNPLETHAHPRYGFTPEPPPPPPPPPGGNDSDEDEDEDDSDQLPPHDVTVQVEACDMLSCSTGLGPGGDRVGGLLAFASTNNPLNQTAGPALPAYSPRSHEILLHVRLIHLGSGWITEGTISNAKAVSFPVPYPDEWQVFLLDPPEFTTADTVDLAGTNFETLQTSLSKGPLYLGTVQADTSEPQQLPCPLNCPTAAADFTPVPGPAALPESGTDTPSMPLLPFIGSGILLVLAFLAYQRYRALQPVYLPCPTLEKTPRLRRLRVDRKIDERIGKTGDTASKNWDA